MFKRLVNLIKGFLSLLIAGMEKRNLEALIALEKENLRKHLAKESASLITLNSLVEHLTAQVKKLETQEWDLRAKTAANLRAGNFTLAGESALQLQAVSQQLGDMRNQLALVETTYRDLQAAHEQVAKVAGRSRTNRSTLMATTEGAEKMALSEAALNKFMAEEGFEAPKALTGPKAEPPSAETSETMETKESSQIIEAEATEKQVDQT